MKVLIVKTSSMGDVIHTLPAISDAQRARPDFVFDWMVEESFSEIPAWHPAVKQVISCAVRRWRKKFPSVLWSEEFRSFYQNLANQKYDVIIDAQGLIKSALLAKLAKGPVWGFDQYSAREPLSCLAYQQAFHVSKDLHAIERIRHLFSQALGYHLPASKGISGISSQQFPGALDVAPYVVLLHGTTRSDKFWPEGYWFELCKQIADRGFQIKIPFHGNAEMLRAQYIASAHSSASVLPPGNLRELATTLAHAQAFVAVDTGLGHLGAALNVPGISLYGSTNPQKIGTYGPGQTHLTGKTMTHIAPEHVLDKLIHIIQTSHE